MPSMMKRWFSWRSAALPSSRSRAHQGRHGRRHLQAAELHARAGREHGGVVAARNVAQERRRALRVAARERDLDIDAQVFARVRGRDRRRQHAQSPSRRHRGRRPRSTGRRRRASKYCDPVRPPPGRRFVAAGRCRVVALARLAQRRVRRRPRGRSRPASPGHLAGCGERREQAGGEEIPGESDFRLHRQRPLATINRPHLSSSRRCGRGGTL